MKRILLAALLLLTCCAETRSQNVTVIGAVTPGHCSSFFSTTQIQDSGATCGSGGGGGGVSSVGLALPAITYSVTGSPVTSSGTLTASYINQNPNVVFAGPPSGAPGPPTWRAIVAGDLPPAGTTGPGNGGTGLVNPTAHSLLMAEGSSPFNLLTTTTAGRIVMDPGAASDWTAVLVSGDCSLTSAGIITCTKTNGNTFGTFATANTATPPIIGGTTPNAGTFSTLTATSSLTTNITGATQCAQINSVGVIGGSGAPCPTVGGVSSVSNSDGTLTISPTTGAVVASLNLAHANTWTAVETHSGAGIRMIGNISSPAWTTAGLRWIENPGTLTDTTSSGTVALAYNSTFGGNTVAATNPGTIYTFLTEAYFHVPIAGSNVTIVNAYALGADSLQLVNSGFPAGNSGNPPLAVGTVGQEASGIAIGGQVVYTLGEFTVEGSSTVTGATVSSGGTGYGTTQTGLITYNAGGTATCSNPPVLNVSTNSSGVITTVNSVSVGGACTLVPTNTATWTPSPPLTAGSGASFNLVGTNQPFDILQLHRHSTNLEVAIEGARSNSDTSSQGIVTNGMKLFTLYGTGSGVTGVNNYQHYSSISFAVSATGTISGSSSPGAILFFTTPNGSTTMTQALIIDQDQSATFAGLIKGSAGAGFTLGLNTATLTGQLAMTSGGTGASLTANNGGVVYSTASALAILPGTSTSGQCLLSGALAAPSWGSCTGGAAVTSVTNGDGTLTISPTTGNVIASLNLTHANTWTAKQTHQGAAIALTGNINQAAWTTSGVRLANVAGTLTDTTSSGTVAAAYTNVFPADSIAASSATTFTNYYGVYAVTPLAGAGVTLTNAWALGADNLKVNGNANITGTLTLTNPLALGQGGTNAALAASNGGIVYSGASAFAVLAGTATAGQCLLSGSNTAPSWGSCSGGAAVSSVSNADGTLTISPTTGAVVASLALSHANTWTAKQTMSTVGFTLSGNITSAAWTTSGVKYANVAATLTDSTSSGTVATGYSSVFPGDTIAASSSTTFTNYYGLYAALPTAGTNVTLTNAWALGADSLKVNGAVSITGALTLSSPLSLANGGTNASLVASNGGIIYSTASAFAVLAGTGTANQCLLSGSNAAPSWGSCGVTSVSNADGTLTISPTTGAVVASLALGHANTWTAKQTISGAGFALSGNISQSAWTTSGVRYANVAGTLTDTTSSGTVATAYTDVFPANTIAASSATTFTNYYSVYIANPLQGTNVTLTNAWALGVDTLKVNGNANITGTLTLSAPLPLGQGGTNAALSASNGGVVYSTASALAVLAGTATAGQCLQSGSNAAPSWGTCAPVTSVSNADGTLTVSPTTGAVVASLALAHANTWTGAITVSGTSLSFSGNISAAAWTTSGVKHKWTSATLTDTSSAGTVAAAYTNVFGGDTIAASSATTYTNYYESYFIQPTAGSNVTFTNRWALGADTLQVNGAASITGTATIATLNLTNALTLPNGSTATTQAATDNTTNVATDAFVQTVATNAAKFATSAVIETAGGGI